MRYNDCPKEYLFEDDRPFPSCHASTLVVLPNGEVLAAYFAGTKEKDSDCAIWSSRRSSGGVWTPPVKLADEEGIAHWNPVLFRDPAGTLLLFYKVGHEITAWHTRIIRSADNGRTWTPSAELVAGDVGGRGPVKNKPIVLSNGAMLAPASLEAAAPWNGFTELWDVFADISYDNGFTWERSHVPLDHEAVAKKHDKPVKATGVIQPALWESDGGRVHMLMRSTAGRIYRSDSNDYGETWCGAYPTELPNNNSGIDLVKMDSGLLALAYNPVSSTAGQRTPLVIRLSSDNGLTWDSEFVLEHEPGSYAYPALVSNGSDLYITYTWKRERIAFRKITVIA